MSIYGFRIPTQREYVLVDDPECLVFKPMLLGGRLYFSGLPRDRSGSPMYNMDLPVIGRDE
jgi:hypothetical protein